MPRTMRRSYGGLSAEQRQAVRRARLLDAGLELLGTAGWTATTMTAVCREAGLTERYFYESFADRDALAEAVFDRLAVGAREAILVAVAVGGDAPAPAPRRRSAGSSGTWSRIPGGCGSPAGRRSRAGS